MTRSSTARGTTAPVAMKGTTRPRATTATTASVMGPTRMSCAAAPADWPAGLGRTGSPHRFLQDRPSRPWARGRTAPGSRPDRPVGHRPRPHLGRQPGHPLRRHRADVLGVGGRSAPAVRRSSTRFRPRCTCASADAGLRSLVDQAPVGICIQRLGERGIEDRIAEAASQRICLPCGLTSAVCIGGNPFEIFRDKARAIFQTILDNVPTELHLRRLDGHWLMAKTSRRNSTV